MSKKLLIAWAFLLTAMLLVAAATAPVDENGRKIWAYLYAQTLYSISTGMGVYVGDEANNTYFQGGKVWTNTISERTSASGVTIDGLLVKDSRITMSDYTLANHAHSSVATGGDVSHSSLLLKGTTTHAILDAFYGGDFLGVTVTGCGNISMNGTATVDGVDISDHAANQGTTGTATADNQIARYDGVTKNIQASQVYIADTGELYWNDGNYNLKFGYHALDSLTTGQYNFAAGTNALTACTEGAANIAIGYDSLKTLTTDSYNTAVGYNAGIVVSGGTNNCLFGYNAGVLVSSGDGNICVGKDSGGTIATGSSNIIIGTNADSSTGGGGYDNQIVIGAGMRANGANSTTIGTGATTAAFFYGDETYICESEDGTLGDLNCYDVTASNSVQSGTISGTTLSASTVINLASTQAVKYYFNDPATYETVIVGNGGTLLNGTTGTNARNNTFLGYNAGAAATNAKLCTFIGNSAGEAATTSIGNTLIGVDAGNLITDGYNNVLVGNYAGLDADGAGAGSNLVSGYRNVLIGNQCYTQGDSNNSIVVGFFAMGRGTNTAQIGNTSMTSIGGQVSWTTTSDAREKREVKPSSVGLNLIAKLSPKEFEYSAHEPDKDTGKRHKYTGLVAQELKTAMDDAGIEEFSGLDATVPDRLGIRYSDFVPVLINAVKELKAENDDLKARIEKLEKK